MAATFITRAYNHTTRKLLSQSVNLNTLKVMLLDATATFVATNTTLVQTAGAANVKQVSGNGWTAGGVLFTGVSVATTTTDDATMTATDIRVRATGGPIGPANALIVFDDTDVNDGPLFYIEFSEAVYAGDGTDFLVPGTIMKLNFT